MTADPATPEEKLTDADYETIGRQWLQAQRLPLPHLASFMAGVRAASGRSRTLQQGMGWEERARARKAAFAVYEWCDADQAADTGKLIRTLCELFRDFEAEYHATIRATGEKG